MASGVPASRRALNAHDWLHSAVHILMQPTQHGHWSTWLAASSFAISSDQQQRIIGCTELSTLDRWLDRAFSATLVDEVFA
jgi:hypothetical protein